MILGAKGRPAVPPPSAPHSRRRRRWLVIIGLQLLALLVCFELGLCLLQRWSPDVRRLLYMPGVGTRFSECRTLPELLDQAPWGFRPLEKNGDWFLNSEGLKSTEYTDDKSPTVRPGQYPSSSSCCSSSGLRIVVLPASSRSASVRS